MNSDDEMSALEKFRAAVRATRASGGRYVVRRLDEAEALIAELDAPANASPSAVAMQATRVALHAARLAAGNRDGNE